MVLPNTKKTTSSRSGGRHDSLTKRSDIIVPVAIAIIFLIIYLLLRILVVDQSPSSSSTNYLAGQASSSSSRSQSQHQSFGSLDQNTINDMRILYIVTSSKEYNTGEKATKKGQDRLLDVVMPVVMDSVESMLQTFRHVDVYMVLGYNMSEARHKVIENLLPFNVGLEIWNDATPIGYDYMTRTQRYAYLSARDKLLARQHRYVVKDKLPYYDFFVIFEDDMLIKDHHILHHIEFMNEIQKYKKEVFVQQQQREQDPREQESSASVAEVEARSKNKNEFWGPLTMDQLDHIKPGFIRVEVLTNHTTTTEAVGRIGHNTPVDDNIDPSLCCHSQHIGHQGRLAPQYPSSDQIVIWETSIDGMHVRQMPKLLLQSSAAKSASSSLLDWVAVLPIKGEPLSMSAYWSGKAPNLIDPSSSLLEAEHDGHHKKKRKPSSLLNEYIGQSAGWMGSQSEIMDYNYKLCKGTSSFIPPFEGPQVAEDGYSFATDSVEFWSGGLQLWGQQCSIQRLIAIDGTHSHRKRSAHQTQLSLFSKHLIYHTANNKQHELPETRFTTIPTLQRQLQQVVYSAKSEKRQKLRDTAASSSWWWWSYLFNTYE